MNLLLTEELSYITLRISCTLNNGQSSVGTGFIVIFDAGNDQKCPLIITNKHVVQNAVSCEFHLTEADDAGNPKTGSMIHVSLPMHPNLWFPHPDNDVDLCAMAFAPVLGMVGSQNKKVFFKGIDKEQFASPQLLSELGAVEDILMVGYPIGLWDSANNMPVFRQGITATHPNLNYHGKKEFLIDAACYPGSSGSPIFLYQNSGYIDRNGTHHMATRRFALLGILYAGPQFTAVGNIQIINIPTATTHAPVTSIPMNLGIAIKAEKLSAFENHFLSKKN